MSNITLKEKFVKIRKPKICHGCLRKFETGTKMYYWVGISDGDFGDCYMCETCSSLMGVIKSEDGYSVGFVAEELNRGETPEQLLERLTINQPINTKTKD